MSRPSRGIQTTPLHPMGGQVGVLGLLGPPGSPLPTRAARLSGVKRVLQSSAASVTLWGRGCQAAPSAELPAPPSPRPRHSLEAEAAWALGPLCLLLAVAHEARGPGARRQRAEGRRERRQRNHGTCASPGAGTGGHRWAGLGRGRAERDLRLARKALGPRTADGRSGQAELSARRSSLGGA